MLCSLANLIQSPCAGLSWSAIAIYITKKSGIKIKKWQTQGEGKKEKKKKEIKTKTYMSMGNHPKGIILNVIHKKFNYILCCYFIHFLCFGSSIVSRRENVWNQKREEQKDQQKEQRKEMEDTLP